MARFPVQNTATAQAGTIVRVLPRALVGVRDSNDNLAVLYTTQTGAETYPNPMNADESGGYVFWLEGGALYNVTFSLGGATSTYMVSTIDKQVEADALASAVAAGAFANEAQAWAESSGEPDGPGTKSSKTSAEEAKAARDAILNLTASASTLSPGTAATASYDAGSGVLGLGIPRGDTGLKGDKGDRGDDGVDGDASLAQAWAESPTAPDGAGTKSAKTLAEEAAASAVEAALYDGPKADTMTIAKTVTSPMVPVGGYLRIVDVGAVWQRAPDATPVVDGYPLQFAGGPKWYVKPVLGAYFIDDFATAKDGVTDDTPIAQKANKIALAEGLSVIWGSGTYIINELALPWGAINLGATGTIVKRPNNQSSFSRIFSVNLDWAAQASTKDSPPIVIDGFDFDGNLLNQGAYTGYELQQQHSIFLNGNGTGSTNSHKTRLKVIVRNCRFNGAAGDGIQVWKSVDLTVTDDCKFWNCFRGSVVMTGGNSRISIGAITCGGDLHNSTIEAEVDAPVEGLKNIDLYVNGAVLDHKVGEPDGDSSAANGNRGMDIKTYDGSTVVWTGGALKAGIRRLDCVFDGSFKFIGTTIRQSQTSDEIVRPDGVEFIGCTIIHAAARTQPYTLGVQSRISGGANQKLRFTGGTEFLFETDPLAAVTAISITGATLTADDEIEFTTSAAHGLPTPNNFTADYVSISGATQAQYNRGFRIHTTPTTTTFRVKIGHNVGTPAGTLTAKQIPNIAAVSVTTGDNRSNNNFVSFENVRIGAGYLWAFKHTQGGNVQFLDCPWINAFNLVSMGAASSNNGEAWVKGNTFGPKFSSIGFFAATALSTNEIILHIDQRIPAQASYMRYSTGSAAGLVFDGTRRIYASAAPKAAYFGTPNDEWEVTGEVTGKPTRYRRTSAGYRMVDHTQASGITANRPVLTALDAGVIYYDSDLSKPVWWTGNAWIDFAGVSA